MKLQVTEFMTLDGVVEDPHLWSFDFWNDEIANYKNEELKSSDAQLLGRVTYEGFASAWPGRKDDTGFADKFNSMPKYVATRTLDNLEWTNSHVIEGDVAEGVARLKEQPGQNLTVHGSPTLVRYLTEHDLIDEYRLLIYPVVLGKGKRLFDESVSKKVLKLVSSETFATGVTSQIYEPAR
jgi:dihydrofolate reductase